MKRRFEYSEGSSHKFWEVTVAKASVSVCFGRIGTGGQVQSKSFGEATAAQKYADKLVAQKLAKGYLERPAA